jgi:hypothetical protein
MNIMLGLIVAALLMRFWKEALYAAVLVILALALLGLMSIVGSENLSLI